MMPFRHNILILMY